MNFIEIREIFYNGDTIFIEGFPISIRYLLGDFTINDSIKLIHRGTNNHYHTILPQIDIETFIDLWDEFEDDKVAWFINERDLVIKFSNKISEVTRIKGLRDLL